MGVKLKHLIDTLLSPEISALPYVDRYGGLVQTMHLIVDDGTENGVKKRYPVACDVTSRDCDNTGIYQDLIPNDSRKSVVYWEEVTPLRNKGVTRTNDFYTKKFVGTARLVFWANLSQLGIDNCNDLFFAIPELEKIITKKGKILVGDYEGFQFWIQSLGEAPKNIETIFGKYDYPKEVQYYLFPNDYFALDVQFELHQCLKKGGSFPNLPEILCPNGAFDPCNYILNYIGDGVGSLKLDCVLPDYDFTDDDTFNALTAQQVTDLTDRLCVPSTMYTPSSMKFNGVNKQIYLPTLSSYEFDTTTKFTLSCFLKINSAKIHNIYNKFSSAGEDTGIFALVLSNNKVRLNLQATSTRALYVETVGALSLSTWTRVDWVYEYTAGNPAPSMIKIYFDGVLQTTTTLTNTLLATNSINDPTLPWRFGLSNQSTNGFDGLGHEFRMWDVALTQAEIQTDIQRILDFNNGVTQTNIPVLENDLVHRNKTGAEAIFGVVDWTFKNSIPVPTDEGAQSAFMEFADRDSFDIPL